MRAGALALLLLLAAGCGGDAAPRPPTVGDAAPEYSAVTLEGDSVSLAELRGNTVLLNIWATWCRPCREEIPALQQLHGRYSTTGLKVVGVSVDAPGEAEEVRRFAQEFGVTYPIWLDPEERVSSAFRTIGVPSTFVINPSGQIVWKHVGPVRLDDPVLQRLLRESLWVSAH